MFFGINDLTAYVIGAVAVILLPGPNSMYCLTVASQHGMKMAYRVVAAILLGDTILILATVLGASTVLQLYPALFATIRIFGGLYLAYLGWGLIRTAFKKWHFAHHYPSSGSLNDVVITAPKNNVFIRALMLSLTNPKAILFLFSFFIPFVEPTYPNPILSFLILAVILQIISLTYLNILVIVGHKLTQVWGKRIKLSAVAMGVVGVMFIGFAVKMWLNK